jgi:hypothetical protein
MKKSAEVAGPIAAASVEETVVTRLRECCDRSAERESTGRRGDAQPGVREVGLVCVTRSRSFGIFPPEQEHAQFTPRTTQRKSATPSPDTW